MTELKEEQEKDEGKRKRLCDFCGSGTAVLYCRADSANLCLGCDREVHSTNPLFTKHTRALLCDACDSAPATIFCCTHAAVCCQNCDWESHNLCLSPAHVRRPLEGFTGCPSVTELLAVFGFQDVGKKALLQEDHYEDDDHDDGVSNYLVWDTSPVVSLDDLIAPNDSKHNFQAMGVPPLPKNRNAACGQHKEEILSQLREMCKLEPNTYADQGEFETVGGFQVMENDELNGLFGEKDFGFKQNMEPTLVPNSEGTGFQWYNDGEFADQGFTPSLLNGFNETNCLVPDKDSDVGDSSGAPNNHNHSSQAETFQVLPKVAPREINSRERETAITRYKEKKKTRRYEKQIRYESRKVHAETRIRIKGRFAKMDRRDTATR